MPNPTTRATARTTTPLTFTYYRGYDSTGAAYPDAPRAIIRGLTFEQAKREFEAHDRQGFIECEQTGAGYYGDEYPWLTRDGREVPSPLEQADDTTSCQSCNGAGKIHGSQHVRGERVRFFEICRDCRGTGRIDPPDDTTTCTACSGTGTDPLSDIIDSILCASCQGTGRAQASSHYMERLDCLRRCIIAASEIEDDLRAHGFERGSARYAAEILARARRALAEHLAAELNNGGVQ